MTDNRHFLKTFAENIKMYIHIIYLKFNFTSTMKISEESVHQFPFKLWFT